MTYRGEQGAGYTPNTITPPLGMRWKLRLQEKGDVAKTFNPPIIKGDTIFFGSDDSNFYALDASTGYMKWIFKTKGPVNSVPFADQDRVYLGSNDGSVYAVGIKKGDEIWNFPTGQTVQSLILRYEDLIIFTSDTGATYFLDLEGKEVQSIPNPVWSHHTFQVYDGVVYWAPQGRKFGAYNIKERSFVWTVDVTVPYSVWYSFPAIDEERVYYASSYLANQIILNYYAMDRKNGTMHWNIEEEMIPSSRTPPTVENMFLRHIHLLDYLAPSLWRDLVIYTSGDSTVRAFDRETGKKVWTKEFDYPTSSAPTVAGDRVYFGIHGDETSSSVPPKLICLSAKTGAILWETPTEGAILSAPVISGRRILFGTDANLFYVMEELF